MARPCSPHRQPDDGPEASADGDCRAKTGYHGHAQDRPRSRLRRMGRSRPMAVDRHLVRVMAVAVVMGVAVDMRSGHKAMLYCNITSVYLGEPGLFPGLTAARWPLRSPLRRTEMAATPRRGTRQSARA